jgi:hypothetical protein
MYGTWHSLLVKTKFVHGWDTYQLLLDCPKGTPITALGQLLQLV